MKAIPAAHRRPGSASCCAPAWKQRGTTRVRPTRSPPRKPILVTALPGKPADAAGREAGAPLTSRASRSTPASTSTPTIAKGSPTCAATARVRPSRKSGSPAWPDGRLAIHWQRPLADVRETLVLEPVELVRRLVDPGAAAARAPHAPPRRLRPRVEVAKRDRAGRSPAPPATCAQPEPPTERGPQARRPRDAKIPRAELLQRVFKEDVLACPCGGRREVIAFVIERKAVTAILEHLGLATTGPPLMPARGSGYAEGPNAGRCARATTIAALREYAWRSFVARWKKVPFPA